MSSIPPEEVASSVFLLLCSAIIFFMTPGLGVFYSGLARAHSALSMVMVCMLSVAVVTLQWFFFGFSLAFSESGSSFIGNFAYAGLETLGNLSMPLTLSPSIHPAVFALFHLQFAIITPALIFGSASERLKLLPAVVFIFLWSTFVYDFVVYWTWAAKGWLRNLACLTKISNAPCFDGALDFAGGGPVHIASGFAGLAYCLVLGKRKHLHREDMKPHHLTLVFLGTGILWFGWFAFNGGSNLIPNQRAAIACFNTGISASACAISWTLIEYFQTKKMSGVAFCCGAVSGLVSVTPGAGFISPWAAFIFGVTTAPVCFSACRLKDWLGFDDALDAFGIHGVGGFYGNILTGIFASKRIAALDNGVISGGWLDGNWVQVGYQLVAGFCIATWSFFMSIIILNVINVVPGLQLIPTEVLTQFGDEEEMGEVGFLVASDQNRPAAIPSADQDMNRPSAINT